MSLPTGTCKAHVLALDYILPSTASRFAMTEVLVLPLLPGLGLTRVRNMAPAGGGSPTPTPPTNYSVLGLPTPPDPRIVEMEGVRRENGHVHERRSRGLRVY